MKLNKKGFMMAEVVVVSAIVLMTLSTLYISYNKIYAVYKSRLNYYDSVTLYRLGYYRDILIENRLLNDILADLDQNEVIDIYDNHDGNQGGSFTLSEDEQLNDTEDRVLLINNSKQNLNTNILDGLDNINPTFRDYVSYLSNAVPLDKANYVMIMERCNSSDRDDCKYAYLEVYDGYEE